jgi:hypothetical protein
VAEEIMKTIRGHVAFAFVLLTAFHVACSKSNGSPSGQGAAIGSQGGSVGGTDGSGITVPAGAIAAGSSVDVTITADPGAPAPESSQWIVVGPPYLFGPEGQQFQQPVTVTLPFDPTEIPSGSTANDVVILTSPATGTPSYSPLTTTVVDSTHVSAQTTHFSIGCAAVQRRSVGSDAGTDASAGDAPEGDGSEDGGPVDATTDAPGADSSSDAVENGDAIVDAAVDADASLACVEPINAAPAIEQTFSCATPPTPAGGPSRTAPTT